MSDRRVPLWLDHASIRVADLAAAVDHLDRVLGLRATVSRSAPKRHSRVYLHRSYLEVSEGTNEEVWEAGTFFLRFEDPSALRRHLETAGIAYRFGVYEGVDGTWDDVEIRAGAVPMPTLIRRTAPPAVARDWPPALSRKHRSGAHALVAVHVRMPSLDEAFDAYRSLLGDWEQPWSDEGSRIHVPLASGTLVLGEGTPSGIDGIVLGVPSLEAPRAALGDRLGRLDEDAAWVDPLATFGLRLGFSELDPLPGVAGDRAP